jgi:predicted MFS family arabinose efflux permease
VRFDVVVTRVATVGGMATVSGMTTIGRVATVGSMTTIGGVRLDVVVARVATVGGMTTVGGMATVGGMTPVGSMTTVGGVSLDLVLLFLEAILLRHFFLLDPEFSLTAYLADDTYKTDGAPGIFPTLPRIVNECDARPVPKPGKQLAESIGAVRRVFENPNLRRIELAFAGAAVGRYALLIVVTIFTFHAGGVTAVAIVTVARQAASATVAPLAAAFTERLRRERVMLVSDLARVACSAAMATIVALSGPDYLIYVIAVCSSMFGAVFRPAEAALITRVARTPQELTAANVATSTFDSVGVFAGPALGAFLIAASGYTLAFALVAGAFLWSAYFVARISAGTEERRPVEHAEEHGGGVSEIVAGFHVISTDSRLRLLFSLYGAQCVVAGALSVLLVPTAIELLGTGNAGVGLLQSACGIGAIIGAALSIGLVSRAKLAGDFGVGLVLWGAPLILIAAVPHAWFAALALAILGAGNSIVDVCAVTLIQRSTPRELTGRVFGVLESVIVTGLGIGALLTPLLTHTWGIRDTLYAVGALLPVLAVLSVRSLRAIDRGASIPEEQIAALRGVPFLDVLPAQTIEFLASRMRRVELPAGAVLFSEGDHGDSFYALAAGTLEIALPDGERKRDDAPGYVGEVALLRDVPRTATVSAVADATLWALDRDDFLGAVTGHNRASSRADTVVAARLGPAPIV